MQPFVSLSETVCPERSVLRNKHMKCSFTYHVVDKSYVRGNSRRTKWRNMLESHGESYHQIRYILTCVLLGTLYASGITITLSMYNCFTVQRVA